MKKIKIIITSFLLLGICLLVASCQPESYSLGTTIDKSDIKYDITQDFSIDLGGNTVVLTNKTKGVTLTWDYVIGKSNKAVETVKYAFKGDYEIKISAVTAGGIVELDPVTITVTDDNLNYVNDPLWTALSGGVGNSKTWVLDLNAEGVSKYFGGPMYFYGTENGWLAGGDNGCYGADCWNWSPDWKGNEWMFPNGAQDFGTMTFSLDGGPFVTVDNLSTGKKESGTYFLDKNSHTLTFSNATMLHDSGSDTAADFTKTIIFSLTENTMQLGVIRINDPAMLVYNFISKDYSDNWVPQDLPDPDPVIDLNGGTVNDLLSTTTTTTKTWHLSKDTPFNWTDLNGNFLNNWNSVADYEAAGWPGYVAGDQTNVVKNKIKFSNDGKVTTIDSNGIEKAGTYTTETGTNIITFSGITPSFPIGSSWATVSTTSQNQWKIVKTAKTAGIISDIWFGSRDESGKKEYMVFHFVLDGSSTGTGPVPQGTVIPFDSSKLAFGDLENNGKLRLELYNDYGSTKANPGLDTSKLKFSESIDVTFTLSGITLKAGAVGSYDASIYYADTDWSPNGNGTVKKVTGNGTYTVTYKPDAMADGAVVFVVDISGLATDITDITAVSATIDSIVIK